jgi:LysM repeat protein
MNSIRSLLSGLLNALTSTVVVVGAISLALAEGFSLSVPTPQPVETEPPLVIPVESGQPTPTFPSSNTALAILITSTPVPATSCPVPPGWNTYLVQPGDTLQALAQAYQISPEIVMQANCLVIQSLLPNTILYLPPSPPTATATVLPSPTRLPCGPPWSWIHYTVRQGDTLFRLSLAYGVSVPDLVFANCLDSNFIRLGEILFVPNVPTRVPPPTNTPVPPTLTVSPAPDTTVTVISTDTTPTVKPSETTPTPLTPEPPTLEPSKTAPTPETQAAASPTS